MARPITLILSLRVNNPNSYFNPHGWTYNLTIALMARDISYMTLVVRDISYMTLVVRDISYMTLVARDIFYMALVALTLTPFNPNG